MKKWIAALLLCAAGLFVTAFADSIWCCNNCGSAWMEITDCGTYHRIECQYCHEVVEQPHILNCSEPGHCYYCGNTTHISGLEVREHPIKERTHDAYTHRVECWCSVLEEGPHWMECYHATGESRYCDGCYGDGAIITEENIRHDFRYEDLGDQHKQYCHLCDLEFEPTPHDIVVDSDPWNPDWHCYHCELCNKKVMFEPHDMEGGSCICGRSNNLVPILPMDALGAFTPMDNINYYCSTCHQMRDRDSLTLHFFYNDEFHWWECVVCGEREEVRFHWGVCAEPGICQFCFAEDVYLETVRHGGLEYYQHDNDTHLFYCSACDADAQEPHAYGEDGLCRQCGYEKTDAALPGDPNGDGLVDIMDALAILRYCVGWSDVIDTDAGDVNDDGACDITDALLILQYCVGWEIELK